MLAMIRFYGTGIVLSAALVGVVLARPAWLEAFGVELPSQQQSGSYLVLGPSEACRVAELRIKAKVEIVDRLRAREMNLFEAAAWFGRLNQEPEKFVDRSWQMLPGDTDEEKLCRQVIGWTKNTLKNSMPSSELALLLTELEGQLSNRLRTRGVAGSASSPGQLGRVARS